MRIISGSLKGRKLYTPPATETSIRPTSDRAREALFNILGNRVNEAMVLDLFAGTGAFGLEALSRNARYVIFMDFSSLALTILKKNISLCLQNSSVSGEIRVMKKDLSKPITLKTLPKECYSGFDIIFVDAPYGKNLSLSTLSFINSSSLLNKEGLLVVEERSSIDLPEKLSHLHKTDQRSYGEIGFNFYQNY